MMNLFPILQSWLTMIKTILTAVLLSFTTVTFAQAEKKASPPAKQAQKKQEPPVKANVKKPCKDGQTEADGCREVKKVEKKAPEKKAAPKKAETKK